MPNARRPNIIFLMTDQQRWDALGCANPTVRTPHLDALAAQGDPLQSGGVQRAVLHTEPLLDDDRPLRLAVRNPRQRADDPRRRGVAVAGHPATAPSARLPDRRLRQDPLVRGNSRCPRSPAVAARVRGPHPHREPAHRARGTGHAAPGSGRSRRIRQIQAGDRSLRIRRGRTRPATSAAPARFRRASIAKGGVPRRRSAFWTSSAIRRGRCFSTSPSTSRMRGSTSLPVTKISIGSTTFRIGRCRPGRKELPGAAFRTSTLLCRPAAAWT